MTCDKFYLILHGALALGVLIVWIFITVGLYRMVL